MIVDVKHYIVKIIQPSVVKSIYIEPNDVSRFDLGMEGVSYKKPNKSL